MSRSRLITFISGIILAAALISSCESDFQVNTENQEVPIVYCVLNSGQSEQYLKLNKTYLTNRAAISNPPDQDSVYFTGNIEIVLEEWSNGNVDHIYIFEPTSKFPKDSGFFPNDNNIIYKTEAEIKPETKYSLSLYLENKEKIVYAEAMSMGEILIVDPLDVPERKISLNIGQNYDCTWKPVDNAGIYQVVLNFHYTEYFEGDSSQHVMVWPQSFTSPSTSGETLSKEISGSRFYYIVKDNILEKENVIRKARGFDIEIMSGGQEIKFYIESTAPSEGALMEKPVYTNIINGLGVFSTISQAQVSMIPIGAVTVDSLAYSQLTKQLGFLDHNGIRIDE